MNVKSFWSPDGSLGSSIDLHSSSRHSADQLILQDHGYVAGFLALPGVLVYAVRNYTA